MENRSFWLGIGTGAVVLALLLGSSAMTYFRVGQQSVEVEFAQTAGLQSGDSVDIAGIQVGTVQSARLEDDHVVAVLRIDPDLELGPDATAAIKLSTILGKMHVDLVTGNGEGLPDNRIPISNTSVPYNLAKVVNDPKYKAQFEHVELIDPQKLRETLDALDTQMGDSPALTVEAINSIGVLAKVIDDRREEVDGLLKNLDSVSTLVSDNQNSVLLLLTRGAGIGEAVAQRQDLVRQLLDTVATLSGELAQMGVENNGKFGPLIQNLNTMSEGLEKNRANLDSLFEIMPVTVRQFNNVVGNGPYGDVYAPWLFPDNWLCFAQVVQGCQ